MNPTEGYSCILEEFEKEGRLRHIPREWEGLDLSSNDYMGLARNASIVGADVSEFAMTSSASRLLSSHQDCYCDLEMILGRLYDNCAITFNSGYHANVGAMQALAIPGTVIASDKLVHASIIDGIRLTKTNNVRFRHNDVDHLRKILEKTADDASVERVLVVTESIFSMDGDVAPIKEMVALKEEFPKMLLYVDEAHAFGVRGKMGLGVCEELGVIDKVDFIAGTFGKAAASTGAFIVTSPMMKEYLVNTARSLIFSTALPPANVMWTMKMVMALVGMEKQREHLASISRLFANGLKVILEKRGMTDAMAPLEKSTHIVPLIVGDAAKAVEISEKLAKHGIKTMAIRRPTVPVGTERLRFSLNELLEASDIDKILRIIDKVL